MLNLVMLQPMFVMLLTPSQESSTKLKLPRSQDIIKIRRNTKVVEESNFSLT